MIKELHQFTALNHHLSSYVATLSLYSKDHSFIYNDFEQLKPVIQNTTYLLNLATENLLKHKDDLSNVPLIRSTVVPDTEQNGGVVIQEQFDLIQKVAYDIFKLSEKIRL